MHSIKPRGTEMTRGWVVGGDDKGLDRLGVEFSRGLREKPEQAKSRSGWARWVLGGLYAFMHFFSKECAVLTVSLGCTFKSIAVTRPVRVIMALGGSHHQFPVAS